MEIIPNWHPIFVHFTVSLFSTAVLFYLMSYLGNYLTWVSKSIINELEIAGRWCLWTVAMITVGTILAGLYAYYTVQHDEISHVMMTNHRNWALPTALCILLVAIWSLWSYIMQKPINIIFVSILLIT